MRKKANDSCKDLLTGEHGRAIPLPFTKFILSVMDEKDNSAVLRSTFYRNFDRAIVQESSNSKGRKFLYFSDFYEIAQALGYPAVGKLLEAYGATLPYLPDSDEEAKKKKEREKKEATAENPEEEAFVPEYDKNAMKDFDTDHFLYCNPNLKEKEDNYYQKNTEIQTMYEYLRNYPLSETKWCCDMLHLLGGCKWIQEADRLFSPTAKAWRCFEAKISMPREHEWVKRKKLEPKAAWLGKAVRSSMRNSRSPFNMNEIINFCNGYNISYRWIISTGPEDVFYGFDPYAERAFDIFTLLDGERQKMIVEKFCPKDCVLCK